MMECTLYCRVLYSQSRMGERGEQVTNHVANRPLYCPGGWVSALDSAE